MIEAQIIPNADLIDGAVCRQADPDLWFPLDSELETKDRARELCQSCPVFSECAAYTAALREVSPRLTVGVWAGIYYLDDGRPGKVCPTCGKSLTFRVTRDFCRWCGGELPWTATRKKRPLLGPCTYCGRLIRARGVKPEDIAEANTVSYGGPGICMTCYNRRRRGKTAADEGRIA